MTVYLQDTDLTLHHGDCLEVLRTLPDRSVHMCATSPPFYGLRDYGAEGQIGLEETPDQWVERLVAVFEEVKRVLRDDGTLWLELGDSFSDKQLVGQPWRVAFALQRAGWFLRSEIIWARLRPNPMPESVTDRPTKAHSTVFLLSKRPRYFYDADAIREPSTPGMLERAAAGHTRGGTNGRDASRGDANSPFGQGVVEANGANARSVWQIPTEPTPFAHFATWPRKLVARMILAGTSERGCCPECGAPWVRDVEKGEPVLNAWSANGAAQYEDAAGGMVGRSLEEGSTLKHLVPRETVGWSPSCAHDTPPVPCTVLDPFAGSGTTLLVARQHGRHSIGIELNQSYCELVRDRTSQQSLLADAQ